MNAGLKRFKCRLGKTKSTTNLSFPRPDHLGKNWMYSWRAARRTVLYRCMNGSIQLLIWFTLLQCYYPGLYVFSWSGVSPRSSSFRLALVKNGREIPAAAWAEKNGYQTGSISIVLYLGQNDRVQLELSEGQLYEPSNSLRGYTTFTGYKLS